MRPLVPDSLPPRSRKSSVSSLLEPQHSSPSATAASAAPETFYLTRDDGPSAASSGLRDSTYGVQSLEETIDETTARSSEHSHMMEATQDPSGRTPHHDDSGHKNTLIHRDGRPASFPLTPLGIDSPAEPISFPSSPKSTSTRSLRPSEDMSLPDEASSHAIASDDDDNEDQPAASQSDLLASDPQLIMPSIRMPSRRPFTERGKMIGRLKIMVAGAPGSGKTSLLKAIVQQAEDIVHVDPLPHSSRPDSRRSKQPERKPRSKTRRSRDRPSISEIYASTRPYPPWWSDLEDSRVLRRRKSLGDGVLERNLCFVDNESGKKTREEHVEFLTQYMIQQFTRGLHAIHTVNADLQNMLSGNGGSQVDVVLYLVSDDTLSTDLESMRRLAQFTNVVPLISKADTLSPEDVSSLKQLVLDKAGDAGIPLFLPVHLPPKSDESDYTKGQAPFAVSSADTADHETMDASVLMSSEYMQPLAQSELSSLIEHVFDRDNIAWLRHSAAKKLIQFHHLHPTSAAHQSDAASSIPSLPPPRPRSSRPGAFGPGGYTLARVADHAQREEQLAQVRLAKWASDLQRSLQNERHRYESLARSERAVWLTERLSECVVDGTLIPLSETPGFLGFQSGGNGGILTVRGKEGRRVRYRVAETNPHDPLGLIRWNDELRRRGWILVRVVGSVGVVGGLAMCVAKVWGLSPYSSSSDWNMGWFCGCS